MNEWEKSSQDFPADWWYQKILYIQLKKIKFGQIDIASKDCYKQKQVGSWYIYNRRKKGIDLW